MIKGPYLNDLLDQPKALRDTIERLRIEPPLQSILTVLEAGAFDRVILTGMGSSLHALHVAHGPLARLGRPVCHIETAELLHAARPLLTPRTLVIAVSQSGAGAEILRLLDLIPSGARLLAVTNTADSPLARQADATLLTAAGPESTVTCKTYVAAVAALIWLVDRRSQIADRGNRVTQAPTTSNPEIRNPQSCGPDLRSPISDLRFGPVIDWMTGYLGAWRDHVNWLLPRLEGVRHIYIVGRGTSLAAAHTAGLILKEAARFPAEAMSSPAFRHGPIEIVGPDSLVLVLEGAGDCSGLNRTLVDDVQAAGGRAFLVGASTQNSPLGLPYIEAPRVPLVEILPFQMLSLALAAAAGIEAGRFTKASKITRVE